MIRLSVVTYRHMLRVCKRLDNEFERGQEVLSVSHERRHLLYKTVYCFYPDSDRLSGLPTTMDPRINSIYNKASSGNSFVELARHSWRLFPPDVQYWNATFCTLKLVNQKISALEQMVYSPNSESRTSDIWIKVESKFLDQREKVENEYKFAYKITIKNFSSFKTHQLLTRHWDIVDANGNKTSIDGDGVLGNQPILAPGSSFMYESHCSIETYHGVMSGWYSFFDKQEGRLWNALIAPFGL